MAKLVFSLENRLNKHNIGSASDIEDNLVGNSPVLGNVV